MASPYPIDFTKTPSSEPPAGVQPNFIDPYNIKPLINLTLGLCVGFSTLFVVLRVWTRVFISKSYGWEDYTMIIAWLMYIGYIAIGAAAENYGSGTHLWDVPLSHFFEFLWLANILEVLYNPLIFITKLSILLQYKRIFCPHNSGGVYWTIHILIWSNFCFYIAVMVPQIVACSPREKIWHPYLEGKCLDLPSILISGACVNILSDFSILILPMHSIWKLQMSTSRKWGISGIFATGLFACISSVMRLYNNVIFKKTQDVTYDLTPVALWTCAEITSGMICGCLPLLPNLFRHFVPKIKSSTIWSRTGKSKNGTIGESSLRGENETGPVKGQYYELETPRNLRRE